MASGADAARRIGDRILGRRIAVGGMAEVFEASGGADPVPAVVKLLLPQYARDKEIVAALRHEAELGAQLSHPNIVRAFGFGVDGETAWLAMEEVHGGTLAELTAHLEERCERLPLAAALHVGTALARALAYVHEATGADGRPLDIVHRDVSPQNVLVSDVGEVKLADFGIARSLIREGRTRTGTIKGKLGYLAPEQATSSRVDARTDVYAAGAVVWELVTGQRWLEGATELDLLRMAEDPPARPASACAEVPASLDRVLARALARFPEERYARASSLADALAAVATEVGGDGAAALTAAARAAFAEKLARREQRTSARRREKEAQRESRNLVPALVVGGVSLVGAAVAASILPGSGAGRGAVDAAVPALVVARPDAGRLLALEHRPPALLDASRAAPDDAGVGARPDARRRAPSAREAGSAALAPPPPLPAPGPPPAPSVADGQLDAARARRASVLEVLAARGLAVEDLPPPLATRVRESSSRIAASDGPGALGLLDGIDAELAAVRVDAALLRRKLARVDRSIAAARAAGRDTRALEALAASALELLLDGRHDEVNRRLNEILGAL